MSSSTPARRCGGRCSAPSTPTGRRPSSAPRSASTSPASAWGGVWARDGLDRRTRSAITLALLAALRCDDELGMHITAARRNGLTDAEIAEVLLHTAVYAGAPAGNSAMRRARFDGHRT